MGASDRWFPRGDSKSVWGEAGKLAQQVGMVATHSHEYCGLDLSIHIEPVRWLRMKNTRWINPI